ncbi:MAG TPA: transposase [Acidobacteriota bacterium]|jgi:REP element-mobilizing transposase RayT
MTINNSLDFPQRKSIRLKGYDYTREGSYYVTLCTQNKKCIFGKVVEGQMELNDLGKIVAGSWKWLARRYSYVELDEWIVMPNHFHGILVIVGTGDLRTVPTDSNPVQKSGKIKPLGRLIGAFKTVSSTRISQLSSLSASEVWQRDFYDHIIRDRADLLRIRQYIRENPMCWTDDPYNPLLG